MNPNEATVNIQFSTATYLEDGKGYAVPVNMNGLFKVDINEGTCEYIHFFMDEPARIENLYTSIVPFGEKLVLVPGSAENLVIFNPKKEEYKTIKVLSDRLNGWDHFEKYAGCVVHNGFLFLPGERYSYVVKVNPESGETEFIDIHDEDSIWTRHGIIKEGGIIKIPSYNTSKLLVFNMQTNKVHIQETYNKAKLLPELKKLENSIQNLSDKQLKVKGNLELYYESVFKSFAKTGRMIIREDDNWISFKDVIDYVEWEKKR